MDMNWMKFWIKVILSNNIKSNDIKGIILWFLWSCFDKLWDIWYRMLLELSTCSILCFIAMGLNLPQRSPVIEMSTDDFNSNNETSDWSQCHLC